MLYFEGFEVLIDYCLSFVCSVVEVVFVIRFRLYDFDVVLVVFVFLCDF